MSSEKWTKANRLTEVINHRIDVEKVGQHPGNSKEILVQYGAEFERLEDGDPIWVVWTTTRTGLDKESIGVGVYSTEAAADEATRTMPVGMVFGDGFGYPKRFADLFSDAPDGAHAERVLSAMFLLHH